MTICSFTCIFIFSSKRKTWGLRLKWGCFEAIWFLTRRCAIASSWNHCRQNGSRDTEYVQVTSVKPGLKLQSPILGQLSPCGLTLDQYGLTQIETCMRIVRVLFLWDVGMWSLLLFGEKETKHYSLKKKVKGQHVKENLHLSHYFHFDSLWDTYMIRFQHKEH